MLRYSVGRTKSIRINNGFQNVLDKSNCKLNKIWVDKDSKFNNKSMKRK